MNKKLLFLVVASGLIVGCQSSPPHNSAQEKITEKAASSSNINIEVVGPDDQSPPTEQKTIIQVE